MEVVPVELKEEKPFCQTCCELSMMVEALEERVKDAEKVLKTIASWENFAKILEQSGSGELGAFRKGSAGAYLECINHCKEYTEKYK